MIIPTKSAFIIPSPFAFLIEQQSILINPIKIMTLRKNQLRKLSIDEISHHLSSQTDPENIKLIHNYIHEKNTALAQRKNTLCSELTITRAKIEKSIRNLNGRVKDRIDKKETVIMDKDSRPTPADITQLMTLFAYLEDQSKIITRNNNSIQQLAATVKEREETLLRQSQRRLEYSVLDQQFEELSDQCRKEEAIRDALRKERDQKRSHYSNIESSIEIYRKQYEKVESEIRMKERQLIQLSGYYQARSKEDTALLQELPQKALQYEKDLMRAQQELNACRALLDQRKMMKIQSSRS